MENKMRDGISKAQKIRRFMIKHVYYDLESIKTASNKCAKKFGCSRLEAHKVISTWGW